VRARARVRACVRVCMQAAEQPGFVPATIDLLIQGSASPQAQHAGMCRPPFLSLPPLLPAYSCSCPLLSFQPLLQLALSNRSRVRRPLRRLRLLLVPTGRSAAVPRSIRVFGCAHPCVYVRAIRVCVRSMRVSECARVRVYVCVCVCVPLWVWLMGKMARSHSLMHSNTLVSNPPSSITRSVQPQSSSRTSATDHGRSEWKTSTSFLKRTRRYGGQTLSPPSSLFQPTFPHTYSIAHPLSHPHPPLSILY
jgi:hypothetical protein